MKTASSRLGLFLGTIIWAACSTAPAEATLILSTTNDATLGGLTFRDGDLADYLPASDTASLFFDEDVFLANEDVDALFIRGQVLYLSTDSAATLGGLAFRDGDIVAYDTTTDLATLVFSEDLFAADENVDALHILGNGHFILSTLTNSTIGGVLFADGDLIDYDPVTNTASELFSEALFGGANENIDSVYIRPNGRIVLSTTTDAVLLGFAFANSDLVEYDPIAGTVRRIFSEDRFADSENVDALHILAEPSSWLLLSLGLAAMFAWRFPRRRRRVAA
jgi:hypothetical protein